jgi:DNA polymerase elongation subunit (family B)
MKFLGDKVKADDVMLLSMVYSYGGKYNDYTDSLEIVYRDLRTNEKKLKVIKKPEMEIYFTKPEFRDYDYSKSFIEMDKTYKMTCPAKNVKWAIAKEAGPTYVNAMKQLVETGNRREMDKIFKYPYAFGADVDVESFYRINWLLEYDNEKEKNLTKAFWDIEVDTIDIPGFPEMGECPINIITLVNDENNTVYTLMLNNPDNPQIQELVDDIDNFVEELHQLFDETYGVLDYQLFLYDDERDLIKDFYKILNTLKPDFLLGWNSFGFDEPYILERMRVLGLDPYEIMCHPDFFNRVCRFVKDDKNFDIKNKSDRMELSSYTKHLDHMRLYAATRKGRSELRSFNLNHVGRMEINDEKIDYSEDANIKTLPYVNYRRFITYNIKDSLLERGIENKCRDVDNLYLRSYSNCTTYDKVFKQTFMLKRRAYYEYFLQGNILANNVNVFNVEDSSFSGALNITGATLLIAGTSR